MSNTLDLHPGIFNSVGYREPTDAERQLAAYELDIEYLGTGISIDASNISTYAAAGISDEKLKIFSVYESIAPKIIDTENNNYIKPPHRSYVVNNKPVKNKKVLLRIDELNDQMHLNERMIEFERQCAYEGTLLVRPAIDPNDSTMSLLKLSPSDVTLVVTPDKVFPYKAEIIEYKIGDTIYKWDNINFTKSTTEKPGTPKAHEYKENSRSTGGMPYTVLRYKFDSRRFWGPFDGSLLSICKLRSLMLADTVHRTQVNIHELLIATGFTGKKLLEATKLIAQRLIGFELDKDADGKPIPGSKDFKFISPQTIEPMAVFEVWDAILQQWMRMRGHSAKNFEVGADPQSAEAQRLSEQTLFDMREVKKRALAQFERELFKRIIWANNQDSSNVQIPEDVELIIDFKPDQTSYTAVNKNDDYTFKLSHDMTTTPKLMVKENPDITLEQAKKEFEENKEENKVETVAEEEPTLNGEEPEPEEQEEPESVEDNIDDSENA